MRIALVAPLVERIPPVRYGGTERVVANLAGGLCARGHEVTLFAAGDADTPARLIAAVDHAIWHNLDFVGDPNWPVARQLAQVMERQHDFDIIHAHIDSAFFPLTYSLEVMSLSTLHGRVDQQPYRDVLKSYPFVPLVSISDAQRSGVRDLNLRWLATVHHGVPVSSFTFAERPGDYLLFLGRMSPEKGPEAAIRIAMEVGMPLKIAAKIPEEDRKYYEDVLVPMLMTPGVDYLGEVNDAQKAELLAGAYALLFPADWPEPFGLSLIESLASGTPVMALKRGSVSEIVIDGENGFVRESVGELVDAFGDLDNISRAACRDRYLAEFTADRMVERYTSVYEHAINDVLPADAARAAD